MDRALFKAVSDVTPQFNPKIMNGLAVDHMRHSLGWVRGLFKSVSKRFPEKLEYIDCVPCTPHEEFNELIRRRNGKSNYDIARNDLFMVKILFRFDGVELEPRFMYLPYVRDAGLITIRGSTFSISPVIADKAISIGDNKMFIQLEGAKLIFDRLNYNFYMDGGRETAHIVWSKIHNREIKSAPGSKPRVTANHTLMHYLLCKFGLAETFRRFCNVDVHCGTSIDINEDNYDPKEWHICSSARIKPVGVRSRYYTASDIRIAFRKADYSQTVVSMIGGFFYVVDHFPERVEPDYVDHIRLWRVLLGHLIFGSDGGEGRLVDDINVHMESLDEYLDDQSRDNLNAVGVKCEDIYDVLVYIIGRLSTLVLDAENSESSMYGKQLMVLRYVLFDINKAIYNFLFAIGRMSKNKLTRNEVVKAMQRNLNQDAITKINRQHGEVSGVSSPGDNKYFKITAVLVPQTSATSGGRGVKTTTTDPTKFLHSSIAEVGSYTNQPKSQPDGRTRINPCLQIDAEGNILRDPTAKPLLDHIQSKIQRN